jgi:hypothetical protein
MGFAHIFMGFAHIFMGFAQLLRGSRTNPVNSAALRAGKKNPNH